MCLRLLFQPVGNTSSRKYLQRNGQLFDHLYKIGHRGDNNNKILKYDVSRLPASSTGVPTPPTQTNMAHSVRPFSNTAVPYQLTFNRHITIGQNTGNLLPPILGRSFPQLQVIQSTPS